VRNPRQQPPFKVLIFRASAELRGACQNHSILAHSLAVLEVVTPAAGDIGRLTTCAAAVALHGSSVLVAGHEHLTPRLWGVADSAPYLHDGRAPSFDYAIAGHGGEGAAARAAFAALSFEDKGALRVYLMSLRREPRVIVP